MSEKIIYTNIDNKSKHFESSDFNLRKRFLQIDLEKMYKPSRCKNKYIGLHVYGGVYDESKSFSV